MMPSPAVPSAPSAQSDRLSDYIVGMRVDVETYATATQRIMRWALRGESRYVCVANVHMAMETRDSDAFKAVVNAADMVTSDGMPLVWTLKSRGYHQASRVYGPDLTVSVCEAAERAGVKVAFFGGTEDVLNALAQTVARRWPALRVAAMIPPPFAPLSAEQNQAYAAQLRASEAGIVFVGLGCPKQEKWMAAMRGVIPAVMIGVGAAFNFHAGRVRQAPSWLQRAGLEWAFRLAMEPRRLWRRYSNTNPRFLAALLAESWGRRRAPQPPAKT